MATLNDRREAFLWLCGWTYSERTCLWDSPKGTERTHMMIDQAVREQFRRSEGVILDTLAGHAWDFAARYEDLRLKYIWLRERTLALCGSAAALAVALQGDETP